MDDNFEKVKEENVPEGYDCLRVLIGYNRDGVLTCCEANSDWDQKDYGIEFAQSPDCYAFFVKHDDEKAKKPIHSFYLEDGKIIPKDASPTKRELFGGF